MNNQTLRHSFAAAILFSISSVAFATTPSTSPASQLNDISDAVWTKSFATPYQPVSPDQSFTQNQQGRENALNGDPRFATLLKDSFHQHQWFWYEHSRLVPIADLIQTFIGVPGKVILNDNRYVTANGCVPHDCGDRGMVWIDTNIEPATVIFAAAVAVSGGPETHLWLFTSKHLNTGQMQPAFLSSLKHWIEKNNADIDSKKDPALAIFKEDIILVTVVQPNGEQDELKYSMLSAAKNELGAKK